MNLKYRYYKVLLNVDAKACLVEVDAEQALAWMTAGNTLYVSSPYDNWDAVQGTYQSMTHIELSWLKEKQKEQDNE